MDIVRDIPSAKYMGAGSSWTKKLSFSNIATSMA
jgi:hypothetical protein